MASLTFRANPRQVGSLRSWADWYGIEASFVSSPDVGSRTTLIWKVLFEYDSCIPTAISVLNQAGVREITVNEKDKFNPFRGSIGDVPFDGINGCENPFD